MLQCTTYKEQYEAAAKTAKELQTQLDEVARLQHAISEAHDVQVWMLVSLNCCTNFTDINTACRCCINVERLLFMYDISLFSRLPFTLVL